MPRTRTFEGDEKIRKWLRGVSKKEVRKRKIQDAVFWIVAGTLIMAGIVAIGIGSADVKAIISGMMGG